MKYCYQVKKLETDFGAISNKSTLKYRIDWQYAKYKAFYKNKRIYFDRLYQIARTECLILDLSGINTWKKKEKAPYFF